MKIKYLILIILGCGGLAYSAWDPFKKKSWDKAGDAISDTASDAGKAIAGVGKDIALSIFDINEKGMKSDITSLLDDVEKMLTNVGILRKSFTGPKGIISRIETIKTTLNAVQASVTTLSPDAAKAIPDQAKLIVDNMAAVEDTVQQVPLATADLVDNITAILKEVLDMRSHLGKAGKVGVNEELYSALTALIKVRQTLGIMAPFIKAEPKKAPAGPAPLIQFANTLRQLDLKIDKTRVALELGTALVTRTTQIPAVVKTIQSYVDTFSQAVDLADHVKAIKKQGLELKDEALDIPKSLKGADPLGSLYKQLTEMNHEIGDVITKCRAMFSDLSVQIVTASAVLKSFKDNLNVDIYKPGTIETLDSLAAQIATLDPLFKNVDKALQKPITHWTAFKELMS